MNNMHQAAFYVEPLPGYLRLNGPDRESFLQRQTTNDVRLLQAQKTLVTVLTSAVARILDVLLLLGQTGSIDLITLPGRGAATAKFLRSRIFFNDQVELTDCSDQYAQILLMGSAIEKSLASLGLEAPPRGEVHPGNLGGIPIQIMIQPFWSDPVYRMLLPKEALEPISDQLQNGNFAQLSAEAYQAARIAAGLPGAAVELSEAYTPLEIGLKAAISSTKGCYTGQEIIARQITYDKVTRRMVGLKLDGPAEVGQAIWLDEKNIGEITSVAQSLALGWIGLAVIKRPFFEDAVLVSVGESDTPTNAEIVPLPF